jgi:enoyl-CoA hydratase/carnithine racemase
MSVELAEFQTLALHRAGPVLHVNLNRPEVRNAMSLQMARSSRRAGAGGAGRRA